MEIHDPATAAGPPTFPKESRQPGRGFARNVCWQKPLETTGLSAPEPTPKSKGGENGLPGFAQERTAGSNPYQISEEMSRIGGRQSEIAAIPRPETPKSPKLFRDLRQTTLSRRMEP